MTNKAATIKYLEVYLEKFPAERKETQLFARFLTANTDAALYSRKNFDGHITTSAFIIDPDYTQILLLRHKSLNRWLQPGGHVEPEDTSLLESALREAEEETTIPKHLLRHIPIFSNAEIPFDIDSHYIPANPKKTEDGHYHHDLRYLFVYTGDGSIQYNEEESTGLKWVQFSDLVAEEIFSALVDKIRQYII